MKTLLQGAVLCAFSLFYQSQAQCAEVQPETFQLAPASMEVGEGLKLDRPASVLFQGQSNSSEPAAAADNNLSADWNWKDHIWLNINGKSYHFKRAGYNEKNSGLGAQIFLSDHSSVLFGHYDNSYRKPTTYLWYNYQPWHWGSTVQVGFIGGLVTGYQKQSIYVPSGIGGLSLTWKPMGEKGILVNIVTVPGVAVVGNIGFKFW